MLEKDISINGLAILTDDPDLDTFYREKVVGGPGAFVITADGFEDFARAMVAKLIREILPQLTRNGGGGWRNEHRLTRRR